jgi:hypothetical protein
MEPDPEQAGLVPEPERYYQSGSARCSYRCVVSDTICICEFVAGHGDYHERVPTRFKAGAEDFAAMDVFKDFCCRKPVTA